MIEYVIKVRIYPERTDEVRIYPERTDEPCMCRTEYSHEVIHSGCTSGSYRDNCSSGCTNDSYRENTSDYRPYTDIVCQVERI